jgi:hypothetical protein
MAVYEMFRVDRTTFTFWFKACKIDRRRGKRPTKAAKVDPKGAKQTKVLQMKSSGSFTTRAGSFGGGHAGDSATTTTSQDPLMPHPSSGTGLLSLEESLDYVRQQREALDACLRSNSASALLARPTNPSGSPSPAHFRQATGNANSGGLLRNNMSVKHGHSDEAVMPQHQQHMYCDVCPSRLASMHGMASEGGSQVHPFGNTQALRQQGILEPYGGHDAVKELGLRTSRMAASLAHPQQHPCFLDLPNSSMHLPSFDYRRSQGPPVSSGGSRTGRKREGSSSRFSGVSFYFTAKWRVELYDPLAKRSRYIGRYASDEDAARAYDCAAVQAHGPDTKRNFPGEDISEPPVALGEEREQRKSSRYISWNKAKSSWIVKLRGPHTKQRHIGAYASEEDAAWAYDAAAVQACGPGAKRNFPDDLSVTSEAPVLLSSEQSREDHSPDGGGAAAQTVAVKVEACPRRSFTVGRVSSRHQAVKTESEPHDGGSGPHAPAGPVSRAAGAHVTADALQPDVPPPPKGQAPSEYVADPEWICEPPS